MRLFDEAACDRLEKLSVLAGETLSEIMRRLGVAGEVLREGSLLKISLDGRPKRTYRGAYPGPERSRREDQLFRALLRNGILIGRNLTAALSTPMVEADIGYLGDRFEAALSEVLIDA